MDTRVRIDKQRGGNAREREREKENERRGRGLTKGLKNVIKAKVKKKLSHNIGRQCKGGSNVRVIICF